MEGGIYINNSIKQLNIIIEQYYNEIYKYCRRRVNNDQTAYDITQNVFLVLIEQFSKINSDSVQQWLYRTAKHKIADFYRELQKATTYMLDVPINEINNITIDLSYNPNEDLKDEELEIIINDILLKLNNEEKKLYTEKFIQKIDYKTLAQKYVVSESVVRKRVSRLRAKITKMIHMMLYFIFFCFFH